MSSAATQSEGQGMPPQTPRGVGPQNNTAALVRFLERNAERPASQLPQGMR
jgi:hypothetical protein